MIRKIITINEELCNGCGLCVNACHESAIGLVDGKAKLLRDDYCDGLGNCLPVCPTGAIRFEEREAMEYSEEEVSRHMAENNHKKQNGENKIQEHNAHHGFGGCPGSRVMNLIPAEAQPAAESAAETNHIAANYTNANSAEANYNELPSMLRQWPVQIQLVPPNAPYFNNCSLLIAADCTAYAYGNFHQFMKNKITLIGCPKLDEVDYSQKLTQIFKMNQIKSITVIRMEVPCCGGIVQAVKTAMANSGQMIPWRVITLGTDGTILEDN